MLLLALPAVVQAQFTFTTNNGTITITRYTGPGGAWNNRLGLDIWRSSGRAVEPAGSSQGLWFRHTDESVRFQHYRHN